VNAFMGPPSISGEHMSNISSRTSPDNYFENFEVGQTIAHAARP
jgi:hypothetical protein